MMILVRMLIGYFINLNSYAKQDIKVSDKDGTAIFDLYFYSRV